MTTRRKLGPIHYVAVLIVAIFAVSLFGGQVNAAGGGGYTPPTSPVCDTPPNTTGTLSLFTTQDGWMHGHTNRISTFNVWDQRYNRSAIAVIGSKRSVKLTDFQWCRIKMKAVYVGNDPTYGQPMFDDIVVSATWIDKYNGVNDQAITRATPAYPWWNLSNPEDFTYYVIAATYVTAEGTGGIWEDFQMPWYGGM